MFEEHSIIKLIKDVDEISKNSIGTIVHLYDDNNYEVEFDNNILKTLNKNQIEDISFKEKSKEISKRFYKSIKK